jgi:hypothetical protein
VGRDGACGEAPRTLDAAEPRPYPVLNAGFWSVWCRTCPWRTEPTPTGPHVESFRAVRAAAEAAWRKHQADEHGSAAGAPAGRLGEVGSAPPTILPEVA